MIFVMGDVLSQLGQVAAIILLIYVLVNILIGLVIAVIFMFAGAWVRDKAELIKKLRPTLESVNAAIKNPDAATGEAANGLVKVVHSIQSVEIPQRIEGIEHGFQSVEEKVGQGADRVASAVIEFRARTAQAQGVLKALFLPGLTRKSPYRHVLPEVALGVSEQSLRESAGTPQLPAAPAPLMLVGPEDRTDGNKRERVAAKRDGSTGNAFRA